MDLTIDEAKHLNGNYKGRYPIQEGLLPHEDSSKVDVEKAITVSRVLVERLKKL